MELSSKQQIVELIKKSEDILLISHTKPGGDAIGSLLALDIILKELGKKTRVVVSDMIPEHIKFLPGIEHIKKDIQDQKNIVLKVDLAKAQIGQILTNTDGEFLNITLTVKEGHLRQENIQVSSAAPKFDCIIVLDTQDVDKIDRTYDDYTNLFFEVPIINIDHHSGNEYFGTINLVELTATSTAEILVSIVEALGKTKLDEDMATCLLAGITADTASFKNINTTPKSLTVAAQLLAQGAKQQDIIQNFYKKKSLKTLKLWGKTLMSVKNNPELRVVWSSIRNKDLVEFGVSIEEAQEVLDDLLANTPGADVIALIMEIEPNNFSVKLKGVRGSDVLEIAEAFGGNGHALSAGFEIKNVGFEAAEFQVIKTIQEIRGKKIGRFQEVLDEEAIKDDDKTNQTPPILINPVEQNKQEEAAIEEDRSEGEEQEKDPISRAIKSLEAAREKEEQNIAGQEVEDSGPAESSLPETLTPLSEILKKFTPGQNRTENSTEEEIDSH
jgi:phosphoesterase RecJ-like protein